MTGGQRTASDEVGVSARSMDALVNARMSGRPRRLSARTVALVQILRCCVFLGDAPRNDGFERREAYARELLYDLHVDPDRLEAVVVGCRREHEQRASGDGGSPSGYASAAGLAERALEIIREAEQAAREDLYDELKVERTLSWKEEPHGFWHRHGAARSVLRRLSPIWWFWRLHATLFLQAIRSERRSVTEFETLKLKLRGEAVGELIFQLCHECHVGYIGKITTDEPFQGRGIATRALRLIRHGNEGYRWTTSGQRLEARSFWRRMGRRWSGYEMGDTCSHLRASRSWAQRTQ